MTSAVVALFPLIALATAMGVPLYAARVRGRPYSRFSGVILGVSLPGVLLLYARVLSLVPDGMEVWPALGFAACMAATGAHLAHLVRARLRGPLFRWLVSVPGQTFLAAGFMATLWLLALLPVRLVLWLLGLDAALHVLAWVECAPLAVAAVSLVTSTRPVNEVVRLRLGRDGPDEVTRVPVERHRRRTPRPLAKRPLRIVQITDPHLGPWQSPRRLRAAIASLVERDPDLVLLTGDFLTMEGVGTPGALAESLTPLRKISDRCYAIFGNHDHEDPDEVRAALSHNQIRLLVDEETVTETAVGPVQIVGADYARKERDEHIRGLLERFPRKPELLRILLLHDPSIFQYVPRGEADLVLSGHTHGGQVGLVSFGLDWTVLSHTRWPDHGYFARGSNRLYVHRGTGFYGFPLRVGVPGEASVIELVV